MLKGVTLPIVSQFAVANGTNYLGVGQRKRYEIIKFCPITYMENGNFLSMVCCVTLGQNLCVLESTEST